MAFSIYKVCAAMERSEYVIVAKDHSAYEELTKEYEDSLTGEDGDYGNILESVNMITLELTEEEAKELSGESDVVVVEENIDISLNSLSESKTSETSENNSKTAANKTSDGKEARKIKLKWTAVEGAEGYEVILKQGNTNMHWMQTSNKRTIVSKSFKRYDDYFVYYSSIGNLSYHDTPEVPNPIYVKVRAYKNNKNGEKVYTKWNAEQIVEFPG